MSGLPDWPRFARLRALTADACPPGELAHDAEHVARVLHWAVRLAGEAGADPEWCAAAAQVHDLSATPKDSPERAAGGARSAAAAVDLLVASGYAPEAVAAITAAVASSSWSRGLPPANPVGAALQDADRLDAIGAIGLLRTVACGQWMSRAERPGRFYDPVDPLARRGRPLDDRRQCLDHLPAKLLKLAAGMHTPTARAEALRRHAWLLAFLAEIERELADAGAG